MFINEKDFIKSLDFQELDNSIILVAKKNIIVPENKIIVAENKVFVPDDKVFVPERKLVLLEETTAAEKQMLKKLGFTNMKGR